MAEYNIPKDSIEWLAFRDFYRFRQKYYEEDPGEEEAFWAACMEDASVLSRKYRSAFLDGLLREHMEDVKRRSLARKKDRDKPVC